MAPDFLHNHRQFGDLIRIVAINEGITSALVEKDLDLPLHLGAVSVLYML